MHKRHLPPLRGPLILALVVGLASAGNAAAADVKNVIVLIPDGQSQSIQTLGRWYRGAPLAVDEMGAGTVAANMVDSITTDSAPAATAMATGYKTSDKLISVGPIAEGRLSTYKLPAGIPGSTEAEKWNWFSYRPLATVLEGAKREGKATGVISTSDVTHATPAGYVAHVDNRSLQWDIAEQLVYQNVDVVFGGGRQRLDPARRPDGEDLRTVLETRGYQRVETASEMDMLSTGKAWGLFANGHMMPDLDRQYSCEVERSAQACDEPTLAEMTAKAIELLAQNPNGFFLVVEGSQVDWAGHANDPAWMLHDFLAFDDAVRVALDFAKKNPDTLILAAPDHNTGGLSLGNFRTNWTYVSISVEDLLGPIDGMKTTASFIAETLPANPTPANIQAAVSQYWGIDISLEHAAEIIDYEKHPDVFGFGYAISKIVSENYTVLGWTTHGHTGEDVPFWSYGANAPVGHIDNTDFAWIVADAFGLNLKLGQGLNRALFVDVADALRRPTSRADDTTGPILRVPGIIGLASFNLPANKDYMVYRAAPAARPQVCPLGGVVVFAPKANENNGRWFAPQKAIDIIQRPANIARECRPM